MSDILAEVKENMLLHGNCEESKPGDFWDHLLFSTLHPVLTAKWGERKACELGHHL